MCTISTERFGGLCIISPGFCMVASGFGVYKPRMQTPYIIIVGVANQDMCQIIYRYSSKTQMRFSWSGAKRSDHAIRGWCSRPKQYMSAPCLQVHT